MKRVLWSTSQGSGGFKATYESLKARSDGMGSYEVTYTTPASFHYLHEDIDSEREAIRLAKKEADRRELRE